MQVIVGRRYQTEKNRVTAKCVGVAHDNPPETRMKMMFEDTSEIYFVATWGADVNPNKDTGRFSLVSEIKPREANFIVQEAL